MNTHISCGQRSGVLTVPASKSEAHRLLICSALSGEACSIKCSGVSKDILATVSCLSSMGAGISISDNGFISVTPGKPSKDMVCRLSCNESGSTLRFLLPVAGALGLNAEFHMAEGLSKRPVGELIGCLNAHGVKITKNGNLLTLKGQLTAGEYRIHGNISSQYVSGLLFALPLLNGDSTLTVTENTESADYILMTEHALKRSGISFEKEDNLYRIPGNQQYHLQKNVVIESDWSNAAFFLAMGAMSYKGISVNGLSLSSAQGDRRILEILCRMGALITISPGSILVKRGVIKAVTVDASSIPDLVPVISVLCACAEGTSVITNAGRLRLKESDRLATTACMLSALGADIKETPDGLTIKGKPYLSGGTVNAANDHRIAMAAATAAGFCKNDVFVEGSECVEKSYPDFWKHLKVLEVNK